MATAPRSSSAGSVLGEHHLGDVCGLPRKAPVTGMNRYAPHCHDAGGVKDADDLGRDVTGEQLSEGVPGVRELARLEQLPGPPVSKMCRAPGLPFLLGGRAICRRACRIRQYCGDNPGSPAATRPLR
jgi:hypothetical protein